MPTPFIDTLSTEERVRVAKASKGDDRPSFFDPSTGTATQISLDMEALLILMDPGLKGQIVRFIETGQTVTARPDELVLLEQVQQKRKDKFLSTHATLGLPTAAFDNTKAAVNRFVNGRNPAQAGTNLSVAPSEAGSYVIDLGALYAAVGSGYDMMDSLYSREVHNFITDTQTGFFYEAKQGARQQTLASWKAVILAYVDTGVAPTPTPVPEAQGNA